MDIDWPTVKEWGLQVPAMAIMFAASVVAFSAIMAVMVFNLRHNRTLATDFSSTMEKITESQHSHQREMRELASEDSQALRGCLEESNKTFGRVCFVLDRHERLQEDQEKLLRKYNEQQVSQIKT